MLKKNVVIFKRTDLVVLLTLHRLLTSREFNSISSMNIQYPSWWIEIAIKRIKSV